MIPVKSKTDENRVGAEPIDQKVSIQYMSIISTVNARINNTPNIGSAEFWPTEAYPKKFRNTCRRGCAARLPNPLPINKM